MSVADPPADGTAERRARAALSRLVEPGDGELRRQLETASAAEVYSRIVAGPPGGARLQVWRSRLATVDVDRDLAHAARIGGRFLIPDDPEWPPGIDDLAQRRPVGLWVCGPHHLAEVTRRSLAIVGARASTGYGEHVAAEITADLAERGWGIVSGAAYGIDSAAHRAALAVGGVTVAVLACGIDTAYPRGHEDLLRRIRREGLVVSELPPGSAPSRARFLERNRLIAALGTGTVVIEAALRSGTARTASAAAELLRPVMAVPGPVTSAMSAGCHELVRGARASLVTDAADVLDLVSALGDAAQPRRRGGDVLRDALDLSAQAVLEAVSTRDARDVEFIASVAGLDVPLVRRQLGMLATDDLVRREPGGWRLVRGAKARLAAPRGSPGPAPCQRPIPAEADDRDGGAGASGQVAAEEKVARQQG
jgi:DNA processing protein